MQLFIVITVHLYASIFHLCIILTLIFVNNNCFSRCPQTDIRRNDEIQRELVFCFEKRDAILCNIPSARRYSYFCLLACMPNTFYFYLRFSSFDFNKKNVINRYFGIGKAQIHFEFIYTRIDIFVL